MTTAAAELKVGALVLISLLLLVAASYYVLGQAQIGTHYPIYVVFDQALVEAGDRVRIAGIDVGYVDQVGLTRDMHARLRVMIRRGVDVYPDYQVTMTAGAVFGERFVDINPVRRAALARRVALRPLRPDEEIKGSAKPGLEDLVTAADALIAKLSQTAGALNSLLGDETIAGSLRSALIKANLLVDRANAAVGALTSTTTRTGARVEEVLANLQGASEEMHRLADEMVPQIEKAALPEQIGATARSLRNTAAAIEDTAKQVQGLLQDPELRSSLAEAAKSLHNTAARIDATGAHVQRATDNIEQASVGAKDAMANLRSASEDVKSMTSTTAAKMRKVMGGKPALPAVKGSLDLQYLPRAERWWTEANVDVGLGTGSLRLGAADIGVDTRLNLQWGQPQGPGTLRLGLVQSKPGIGYDQAWPDWGLSLDLYDPNHLKGNLILERPLNRNYSLVGGLRNAGDDREETAAVGVRVRR